MSVTLVWPLLCLMQWKHRTLLSRWTYPRVRIVESAVGVLCFGSATEVWTHFKQLVVISDSRLIWFYIPTAAQHELTSGVDQSKEKTIDFNSNSDCINHFYSIENSIISNLYLLEIIYTDNSVCIYRLSTAVLYV